MATNTIKKPIRSSQVNTYQWQGYDKNGRKISGKIVAKDLNLARASLRRQEIKPSLVKLERQSAFSSLFKSKSITEKDISFFTRQLSTMLDAGVPLVTSLDIIGRGHKNPKLTEMLNSIRSEIESGTSLSTSLIQHPKCFDDLYVNLVASGELSGTLDKVLKKIADYKERMLNIKGKVKRSMIYPVSILIAAVIVTFILLLYVIPVFEDLFKSVGTELPALTQWVINLSHFVASSGWLILIALIILVLALMNLWKKSEQFQRRTGRLVLRIPVLGKIQHNAALARFARTLTTTFGAGVPILQALSSVAETSGNALFADAILRMREGVKSGQTLNFTMLQESLFPPLMHQMATIGEESGSLEHMMEKAADYYEGEVDAAIEVLTTLMEPLIIVIIGVIVGTLVVSMYLPIFHLAEAF